MSLIQDALNGKWKKATFREPPEIPALPVIHHPRLRGSRPWYQALALVPPGHLHCRRRKSLEL